MPVRPVTHASCQQLEKSEQERLELQTRLKAAQLGEGSAAQKVGLITSTFSDSRGIISDGGQAAAAVSSSIHIHHMTPSPLGFGRSVQLTRIFRPLPIILSRTSREKMH